MIWEKGDIIERKINKDCGSFPSFRDWIWFGMLSWGRNVYVTLERKKKSIEVERIFIIAMENCCGFSRFFVDVFVLFRI